MDEVEKEFRKIFGDMYLSESETALRIFEFGYKAGLERAMQMIDERAAVTDAMFSDGFSSALAGEIKGKLND